MCYIIQLFWVDVWNFCVARHLIFQVPIKAFF